MPIRLIAIDMDGTLLNSAGHVSPRNLAALERAEARGIEIVVATGRRHCYAMRVLRELARPPAGALISSNGTVIRTLDSQLLHRSHMPVPTARWLCRHLGDFRNTFDRVRPDGEDDHGALVCEDIVQLNASIGRWMEANAPYIQHVSSVEQALGGHALIQMMLCGSIDRMRQAEAHLLKDRRVTDKEDPRITNTELPHVSNTEVQREGVAPAPEVVLHRTEYAARDLCILDILPAGCSKASALLHLASLRHIAPSEILAIGDNWNDVPMLRAAGHAVVMANAPADLRALATQQGWSLTASNDEDGVAHTIDAALP
jgi:hypothetical protein